MEGQSSASDSQYQYHQSAQWSRFVRRNTLAATLPSSSPPSSIAVPSQLPPQIDLLPVFLPQQSSYHQAQLAQYNRLITAGRTSRLQSSPLPPLLSAQHIQAVPGIRSSSTAATTSKSSESSGRGGHGNKTSRKSSKGERALMTEKDKAASMPAKKLELSNQLPMRPQVRPQNSTFSQQSNSVPSTPHQHARKFSCESREPSPQATNNHSPRSAYSESNISLPTRISHPIYRAGCKFETALAHTKRRMPYSIGSEKLEKCSASSIKSKLSEDEERKLSTDMRELYDRLLPTPKSDRNRELLVQKLENLFNSEWPGHDIRVHVFGSSGNMLCTDESDVDICITTDWKEMEGVCIIAELLAKNGMEKVICVSTAKVPIVKIWDPELQLHCDMNVNNTLALENTRMIKTYVQIDPRIRPLAMIIKHWTKRRILNDAAFGGTLSSYTWICMIIFFLQSRSLPILPALHQRPHMKLPPQDGVESTFADDLSVLAGFGKKNKESLGELLFQFFRFYGHEFDYENAVISVRHGKLLSKVDKGWHKTNNNRLCVEEPFNVGRNLGNTADDMSFRGLHMELRRAFDLVAQSNLEECCAEFKFPLEEERVWVRPAQKTKPVSISVSRSASQSAQSSRGGKSGSHRGGRNNHPHRNGNGSRRASSGAFDQNAGYAPVQPGHPPGFVATGQDAWLQRQAQAQLHNDLYTTYSVLQAQENSLRLQLYTQGLQNQAAYAQAQAQARGNGAVSGQQATDRNRTSSFDQPPLTAPLRPDMYFYPLHYPSAQGMYAYHTPNTNPSSPSLSSTVPELRRSLHRSTVTNGSGPGGPSSSSLRSQSQPAVRSVPSQMPLQGGAVGLQGLGIYQPLRPTNGYSMPNFIADENLEPNSEFSFLPVVPPVEDATPREYVGYYVGDGTNYWSRQTATPMAIPTFGDLGQSQSRRRLSTDQLPQSILDRLNRSSRSPSPLGHDRSYSTGAHPGPLAVPLRNGVSSTNLRAFNDQAPAVVNGSNSLPLSIPTWQAGVTEGSGSEDRGSDLAVGSLDSFSLASGTGSDDSGEQDTTGQVTPREPRPECMIDTPLVVNGSTPIKKDPETVSPNATSNGNASLHATNGSSPVELNGHLRLSPGSRNRITRQNGGISPLDIGLSHTDLGREDLSHLSPVYETRTPSPTANRKFDPMEKAMNGTTSKPVAIKMDPLRNGAKSGTTNGNSSSQLAAPSKVNGHTRGSKSEGAPGSWQKILQKNKKKASAAEMKAHAESQLRGEKPPTHANDRKGG